jgi:glycosyltransferase involved in cell wall biosynthesis
MAADVAKRTLAVTRIAILVPCLNEAEALPVLFSQIREHIPEAVVHVFDNDSPDKTGEVAAAHGARVHSVLERGKGRVVSRMFSDVDADVFLMVDGDGTYDLHDAREHVARMLEANIDMLMGSRVDSYGESRSRRGHEWGNRLITWLLGALFKRQFQDVLTGYRMMSRRFVKTAPVMADGFEVETMLTVHALEIRCQVVEVPIRYLVRAVGSTSKLKTFQDGARILRTIAYLLKEVRPLYFFSLAGTMFGVLSFAVGVPVITEFFETGLVPRFPSAILAAALMLTAVISFTCGLVLDSVAGQRREMKRIAFLAMSGDGVQR